MIKTFYRRSGLTGPILDLQVQMCIPRHNVMPLTMLHNGCVIILYAGLCIHIKYAAAAHLINIQNMRYLDVQGRAEKTCNSRPEDVKDVGSILAYIFFHHDRS